MDSVRSMTKMRQDNDVIDITSLPHTENKIGLLLLIRRGMIYDENETRQQRD